MRRTSSVLLLLIPALAVGVVGAASSTAAEHAYVGTKNCKKCHIKEFRSWEATTMAQAFELLKPGVRAEAKTKAGLDPQKDYTADKTCLPCHTTGFGKPGGFVDIATTPDLAGTGCEMCHGAGGTYTQDQHMSLKNKEYKRAQVVAAGMVERVGRAQCVTCHNAESPFVAEGFVFDFEANKDKGVHEIFPLKYAH